jgi:hypothetical protein
VQESFIFDFPPETERTNSARRIKLFWAIQRAVHNGDFAVGGKKFGRLERDGFRATCLSKRDARRSLRLDRGSASAREEQWSKPLLETKILKVETSVHYMIVGDIHTYNDANSRASAVTLKRELG